MAERTMTCIEAELFPQQSCSSMITARGDHDGVRVGHGVLILLHCGSALAHW